MTTLLKQPLKLALIQLASGPFNRNPNPSLPSLTTFICRSRQSRKPQPCARQSPRSRQSRRQTNRPPRMLQLSLRHTILPQICRNAPPFATHRGSVAFISCTFQTSRRGEIVPCRRKYSGARTRDEEILQHITRVLAYRRIDWHTSQNSFIRY